MVLSDTSLQNLPKVYNWVNWDLVEATACVHIIFILIKPRCDPLCSASVTFHSFIHIFSLICHQSQLNMCACVTSVDLHVYLCLTKKPHVRWRNAGISNWIICSILQIYFLVTADIEKYAQMDVANMIIQETEKMENRVTGWYWFIHLPYFIHDYQ